jgi:hypothetical protein
LRVATRKTVRNVRLKSGDVLRVGGVADGSDPAALDYVEVTPVSEGEGAKK